MNTKKTKGLRTAVSVLLILTMLFSPVGYYWLGEDTFAASEDQVSTAVSDTLTNYFETSKGYELDNWEEMMSVKASGGNLENYLLPPTETGTKSTTIFIALMKGDLTTASRHAADLVIDGEVATAGDAFKYAQNIIALEAYNRSVEDENKISYNTDNALETLLSFRTNDVFLDPYFPTPKPGGDMVGMALVALSLFDQDNPTVSNAVSKCKEQIKAMQAPSGAFVGPWGDGKADANTTAVIIWGLMAADALNIESYTTEGSLTPVDGLLSFYVPDGGYDYFDNDSINGYATNQAALAMADIYNKSSYLANLKADDVQLTRVEVQHLDNEGNFTRGELTLGNSKTIEKSLQKLLKIDTAIELNNYNIYINGELEDDPASVELAEGDSILAVAEEYTKVVYFKTSEADIMNVNKINLPFKGSIELTLIEKDLSTNEEVALSNKPINYGDALASNLGSTNADGKITITPVEANTEYPIAAKRSGWTYEGEPITYIQEDTAILPAIVTMSPAYDPQIATVSLRIEGPESNIFSNTAFTVGRTDGSRLTVYDAVTQALEQSGITYHDAGGKYIDSIAGIQADNVNYYGWMYNIIDPKYLDGTAYVSGMGTQFLSGGEQVLVYYGGMSTAYPIVTSKLNSNGSVTISIKTYVSDPVTWEMSLVPATEVNVYWGYTQGTEDKTHESQTDVNGEATIPAEYATTGLHSLQISRMSGNIPTIIRLAPDYTIGISSEGTSVGGGSSSTEKLAYLTVKGPNGNLKSRTAYTWYKGMTALSILQSSGLSFEMDSTGKYVSSIEGIGEFDLGENSGWLYSVNGITPPTTASSSYKIAENDNVLWYFSKDYTKDSSSSAWVEPQVKDSSTIVAKVDSTGKAVAAIAQENFSKLAENPSSSLNIESDLASLTFDHDALKTIAKAGSGDVKITVSKIDNSKLSQELQAEIGDRPVYDLSVTVGSKTVSAFNGKVQVSIPYTPAADEDIDALVVYYVKENGQLEVVKNCKYDNTTKRLIFDTDHFSNYVMGYNKVEFNDTKGHWSEANISYLASRGIIKGKAAGQFMPNDYITRAEFVTILGNKIGADFSKNCTLIFNDVTENNWFAGAVSWAAENKIVTGYNGKFRPNDKISRQEMAVILDRFMTNVDRANIKTDDKAEAVKFTDENNIADYAKESIIKMQKLGIINGKTASTFAPADNATRAETAKMITVLMKQSI